MQLKVKILIVVSAGLLTLAADQATKVWARGALLAPGEFQYTEDSGKKAVIPVIGSQPGMEFRLSFNKGSAFGLFSGTSGARVFLSIVGLFALGLIFYLLKRPESDSKVFVYALGFVAGGAVGNLVDRIAFGEVTDFIWVWLTPSIRLVWPWPAFNIADVGLVVGVGLMIPAMLLQKAPVEQKPSAEGSQGAAGETVQGEAEAGEAEAEGAGDAAEEEGEEPGEKRTARAEKSRGGSGTKSGQRKRGRGR